MRTHSFTNISYLISSIFLMVTLISCGSYQGVSYYASDGIYGGDLVKRTKPVQEKLNNNGVYYKDYFSNVADDYASLEDPQNYVYTDSDNYTSHNGNNNVRVNSQAPWGDRTTRTEVYFINNNPWGYFNANWGFYNSFYDPFWGYSPYFRGYYRNPYWGAWLLRSFLPFWLWILWPPLSLLSQIPWILRQSIRQGLCSVLLFKRILPLFEYKYLKRRSCFSILLRIL